MALNGRKKIVAPYEYIDSTNIVDVLKSALQIHIVNKGDMDYLYNYYKGIHPIHRREKYVRPEINNKVAVNYARQIVSFKTGYLLWKPIQYVARKETVNDDNIITLNDFGLLDNKRAKDKQVANYQSIMGTAFKYIVKNPYYSIEKAGNEAPYITRVIDPRMAFAIYSSLAGNEQIGGVILDYKMNEQANIVWIIQCFTKDRLFIANSEDWVIEEYSNVLGLIPVVEFPLNEERVGDFEAVIDILDGIDKLESNRLDGVEQVIQSLMVFKNVDIDSESFKKLKQDGAIKIKDVGNGDKKVEADVKFLTQELNQEQTQKLKDDLYQAVLEIVGMPQSNITSSGDNNGAVVLKGGWQSAETRATDTETYFEYSERKCLRITLEISSILTRGRYSLNLSDVDIKFTRRNYEDILAKAQVLTTLLKTNQVAPRLAFQVCGLFSDPDACAKESEEYAKMTAEQIALLAMKKNGSEDLENDN